MSKSRQPKDAIEDENREREFRLLLGCERCGRSICHIDEQGVTHSVSSMAIIPDESVDEHARMYVCEFCHGAWLMDRLFGISDE